MGATLKNTYISSTQQVINTVFTSNAQLKKAKTGFILKNNAVAEVDTVTLTGLTATDAIRVCVDLHRNAVEAMTLNVVRISDGTHTQDIKLNRTQTDVNSYPAQFTIMISQSGKTNTKIVAGGCCAVDSVANNMIGGVFDYTVNELAQAMDANWITGNVTISLRCGASANADCWYSWTVEAMKSP